MSTKRSAFTLIELLIVVAIIAILAAIAVPNFLEAQVRSKVSRAKADMRSIATAIEAYAVDYNRYPEGTDSPTKYPQHIADFLGPLAGGYYTFRTRTNNTQFVGSHFSGVTTPIAYITNIPTDPFAGQAATFLTYCYRSAKDAKNGWVLTSVGPDTDLLESNALGTGIGNLDTTNPLSTAALPPPGRLGDVNEREVIRFYEGNPQAGTAADIPRMSEYLHRLSYDPTNGTISDGDITMLGAGAGFQN